MLNVEIKAKCSNAEFIHQFLKEQKAKYIGCDHQIDTYFHCDNGRLKLRQGNIENSLIFYKRNNQKGPKDSEIALSRLSPDSTIGLVLERAYSVKVIVDKQRYIYFLDNVKFHIDEVKDLGNFMEIEAIDEVGDIGIEELTRQCSMYMELLQVKKEDLIDCSYSDLLLS